MAGKAQKSVGLQYIGPGDYIPGVPARDLTSEEAAEFRDLIAANYRATGVRLYIEDATAVMSQPVQTQEE